MPVKYVPFIPEPVEGQAVLQNFNRVLSYKGNSEPENFIKRGMPLYEMEKIETVGKEDSGNLLIRGECVSACAYLKENNIKVDLVYIDPPFASGADYAKKIYIRRNPKVAKAILKAEEELDNEDLKTFEEKMYGDVWDKEKYLNWMYENLCAIKSIMSEKASIYVHLDYHIGHYVKILLDEIFMEDNFKNEICWRRGSVKGAKAKGYQYARNHDAIYYYSISDNYVYNRQFLPFSDEYKKRFDKDDNDGKGPYRDDQAIGTRSRESIDKMIQENKIVEDKNGNLKIKTYLKELPGIVLDDYWYDIPEVNVMATENCNYSTQKPEALLERIIKTSSNKDMIVADFFGGSGVVAKVASDLGRKFIHADIGINSIQTSRDRLIENDASFDVLEIKDGVQLYRNPVQTMDKIKLLIPGLKNEDSLNSFWEGSISDSKNGMIPVYIPNLMDSSSKLLDEVMVNRILHQAIPDLDSNVKKVIVYYIDITSIKAIEEFIEKDDSTNAEIELRDLKDILDDVVVEDHAEFTLSEGGKDLFAKYNVEIISFFSDRVIKKIEEFNEKGMKSQIAKGKAYEPITISDNGLETIEWVSVDCSNKEEEWHSDAEIKIDKDSYVIRDGKKTKDFWDGKIYCEKKPLRLKIRNICGDESIYNIK